MAEPLIPVFDGHNDMLYQMLRRQNYDASYFYRPEGAELCINAEKAQAGGFSGGFFALFAASQAGLTATHPLETQAAFSQVKQMLDIADALACRPENQFSIIDAFTDISAIIAAGDIPAILHLEGAEAVGSDLQNLEYLYHRGIRSIGPLWSRRNDFGEGVSFSFPGSPDEGGGLTDAGKALVAACDEMGIMLDTSHLNEKGFWDIARLSGQRLVATHSNVHRLCPSPRNLNDRQLDAIAERGGMVGVCFATAYLRADGQKNPDTSTDILLTHIDALIQKLGEDRVGLGSDFDGAVLLSELSDASMLPNLIRAMQKAGFGEKLITKICAQNWINFLSEI